MVARVALATDQMCPGGVSHVITQLAGHLTRRGYHVDVVAMRRGEWDSRLIRDGIAVHTLPSLAVARTIRRADIVHAHQRTAGMLASLVGAAPRMIEHVHNEMTGHRLLSFRAPTIVTVSDSIRRQLQATYPRLQRSNISVVPNGAAKHASEPRPLVTRDVDLLGVGRLETQKDPMRFLDLVCQARTDRPGLHAIWLAPGDGSLRNDFLHRRSQLGLEHAVELRVGGSHAQTIDLLGRSKILVLTSRWEGLPLVALEALAEGTPVVTTPCGDIADIIRLGGCGAVVAMTTEHDVSAVARLLDDETAWKAMAANAFETADSYTDEAMVRAVEDIYSMVNGAAVMRGELREVRR